MSLSKLYSTHLHTGVIGVEDNKRRCGQVQVVFLHEVLGGLEGPSPVGHTGAAGVGGAALLPVVHQPRLLKHEEAVSVIPVTLGQHQREQQLEDDLAVIHRVSGNVGNKPVPELGQSSEKYLIDNRKIINIINGNK